ncbi:hypothetical protein J3459_011892 [Metarhizium acridum]|nr:hypothetical protein J3459_011892 [Metarhizium acridum]
MGLWQDWWGVLVTGILVLGRLLNFGILRRRARQGWKGAEEPGVEGELIVLLSQDHWVRIRGAVDDLKAITSGQWLRDMASFDKMVVGVSTMLVYLDAALASNLKMLGKVLLIVLLVAIAGLLEISNAATNNMFMHGRVLGVVGQPQLYDRRLSLAKQLIDEYGGKSSWAIETGMVNEEDLRSMNDSRDATQASVTCRDVADAHGVVQAEEGAVRIRSQQNRRRWGKSSRPNGTLRR